MRYEVRMIVETKEANIVDVFDVATEVANEFVDWSEKLETALMVCKEDVFVIELDDQHGETLGKKAEAE